MNKHINVYNALKLCLEYNTESALDRFIYRLENNPENISDITKENAYCEMFYQILVLMFGDYGTSPRAGWIEDVNGAITFLKYLRDEC